MREVHREKDFKGSRSEQARKRGISRKRCGEMLKTCEEKRRHGGKEMEGGKKGQRERDREKANKRSRICVEMRGSEERARTRDGKTGG